jgi:hypothetical protein
MMLKSRMMKWAGRVACMGELKNAYKIFVGKYERKRPVIIGVDGRIMLELVLGK